MNVILPTHHREASICDGLPLTPACSLSRSSEKANGLLSSSPGFAQQNPGYGWPLHRFDKGRTATRFRPQGSARWTEPRCGSRSRNARRPTDSQGSPDPGLDDTSPLGLKRNAGSQAASLCHAGLILLLFANLNQTNILRTCLCPRPEVRLRREDTPGHPRSRRRPPLAGCGEVFRPRGERVRSLLRCVGEGGEVARCSESWASKVAISLREMSRRPSPEPHNLEARRTSVSTVPVPPGKRLACAARHALLSAA